MLQQNVSGQYVASAKQAARERCAKQVAELQRRIGEDPNWFIKHGIVLLTRGDQPLLAYLFAVDIDLGCIDFDMLQELRRDAMAAELDRPRDLRILADQLCELVRPTTIEKFA